MKLRLPILLSIVFSLFFFHIDVSAFTLDPSSGSFSQGSSYQLEILANPPENAEAIEVILNFTGGITITGYTEPDDSSWGPGAIGSCNVSNDTFTSNSVCFGLAKSVGFISNGESLGVITLTADSMGDVTAIKASGNGYVVSSVLQADSGTPGIYQVVLSGSLPETAFTKGQYGILLGSGMVLAGIVSIFGFYITNKPKVIEQKDGWGINL
ncbi:MAG TPA: hypothetical protein VGA67_02290 [Candidatus Dojkabacteria bacterium]|jgi:hypothetical protein